MNRRSLVSLFVLVALFVSGLQTVHADVTWDAYTGFSSASNTASDTWQYLQVAQGVNSGYTLFGAFASSAPWAVWQPTSSTFPEFPFLGKNSNYTTGLSGHPGDPASSKPAIAIGWKAPTTGVYNASFSVASNWPATEPGVDGIAYWLFKQGDTTALSTGTLANMTSSGPLSVNGVSVTAGDMLYLQVGPGANLTSDQSLISFTVTSVPEPGALTLLGCGLLGLMAYAWRKRK